MPLNRPSKQHRTASNVFVDQSLMKIATAMTRWNMVLLTSAHSYEWGEGVSMQGRFGSKPEQSFSVFLAQKIFILYHLPASKNLS